MTQGVLTAADTSTETSGQPSVSDKKVPREHPLSRTDAVLLPTLSGSVLRAERGEREQRADEVQQPNHREEPASRCRGIGPGSQRPPRGRDGRMVDAHID